MHFVQEVTCLLSTVQVAQFVEHSKHKVYFFVIPLVFPQAPVHEPPSQVSLTVHPVQLAAHGSQVLVEVEEFRMNPALQESHPPATVHVAQLLPHATQALLISAYPDSH